MTGSAINQKKRNELVITIKVRQARIEDIETIAHFNSAMAKETEDIILNAKTVAEGVKAVFKDPKKGFYLVVELQRQVKACLMITTEWSDWRNGFFWWIQSVYVSKEFRKQGLYKAMYAYLLEQIKNNNDVAGIRLYVEHENKTAQKTYEKLGMHKTDYLMYEYTK